MTARIALPALLALLSACAAAPEPPCHRPGPQAEEPDGGVGGTGNASDPCDSPDRPPV